MGRGRRCGRRALSCVAALALQAGCIGPSTPLGAVDDAVTPRSQDSAIPPAGSREARAARVPPEPEIAEIRFSPPYQQVHGPYPWRIVVTDPSAHGVPEESRVRVFYGDQEVSESAHLQFREAVEVPKGDPVPALVLTLSPLRLDALREHAIRVEYTSAAGARVVAEYPFPEVRDLGIQEPIHTTRPFAVAPEVLEAIDEASRAHRVNPVVLAALVAQESSFDPLAVSRARAIGLTQITHLAERDISRRFSRWPRYPGIQKLSRRKLRRMIPKAINRRNEWRLDPVKSIWGGAYYLGHLRNRLEAEANAAVVARGGADRDRVVTEAALAAYNSGLNRILYSIARHGEGWLDQRQTREAKRYVRKILSYYGAFRNEGGSGRDT